MNLIVRVALGIILSVAVLGVTALGQGRPAPVSINLSGTWELTSSRTHSDRTFSYVRTELNSRTQVFTISHNGPELEIQWSAPSRRSPDPQSWSARFFTDGRGETNAVMNDAEIKTKTKLRNGKVVIEGWAKGKSGHSEKFRDEFSISDDGKLLTIETFRSGDVCLHGRQILTGPTELRLVRTFKRSG